MSIFFFDFLTQNIFLEILNRYHLFVITFAWIHSNVLLLYFDDIKNIDDSFIENCSNIFRLFLYILCYGIKSLFKNSFNFYCDNYLLIRVRKFFCHRWKKPRKKRGKNRPGKNRFSPTKLKKIEKVIFKTQIHVCLFGFFSHTYFIFIARD